MMRSMYAGVAGLKTHQTKMDVIGNNIANVNTVAYKSQSVTFSELMYQTTQSASGANATTGTAGVNARQIGLGVKTGGMNTSITTEGASQTTNNPFDIRITGDAFFIVSDGSSNYFTRDGSFYVDGMGNLAMTSNGYNVMGWQVDSTTGEAKQDTVSALRVMSPENMTYPPESTTKAYATGIVDKNDTNVVSSSGKTINLMFYDKLGYSYTAKMNIKNTTTDGQYTLQVDSILDSTNKPIDISSLNFGTSSMEVNREVSLKLQDGYSWDSTGTVLQDTSQTPAITVFTAAGAAPTSDEDWAALAKAYGYEDDVETFKSFKLSNTVDTTQSAISIGDIIGNVTDARTNAGVTPDATGLSKMTADKVNIKNAAFLNFDKDTGKFVSVAGGDAVNLQLSNLDERFSDVSVDFSTTTMYNNGGSSTITATNGDTKGLGSGRKIGKMNGISIQNDGKIYAAYDNGQTKLLGQIAVAEFSNASGLEKKGDNLYQSTQNSGDFDGIGVDIKANSGYMTTGVLEMSNVDLSSEFTEMITTQRGFQANSRIITVSDTMLEELVNLKR